MPLHDIKTALKSRVHCQIPILITRVGRGRECGSSKIPEDFFLNAGGPDPYLTIGRLEAFVQHSPLLPKHINNVVT